jgi:hypothetical protein
MKITINKGDVNVENITTEKDVNVNITINVPELKMMSDWANIVCFEKEL